MRDEQLDRAARGDDRAAAFAAGPPRPERAHLTAVTSELLGRIGESIIDWSEWAEAQVEQWADLGPSAERSAEAMATMNQIVRGPGAICGVIAPDLPDGPNVLVRLTAGAVARR